MGHDGGFIALKSGIATGAVAVMTPEMGMSIDDPVKPVLAAVVWSNNGNVVIVAEGGNGSAFEIAKRVRKNDNTSTHHRTRSPSTWRQRSCFDRVLASRLGVAAVETLRQGHSDVMAGVVGIRIELTPFSMAISTKSTINEDEVRITHLVGPVPELH